MVVLTAVVAMAEAAAVEAAGEEAEAVEDRSTISCFRCYDNSVVAGELCFP